MKTLFLICLVLFPSMGALSQDTVNVTFRYRAPSAQSWQLVGEFTNWASGGRTMSTADNVTYVATIPLLTTGQPGGYITGAYEYKFYYSGISGAWPNDPLNPRTDPNPNQNGNSILYVRNPTIHHLLVDGQLGIVRNATPVVSAYLYPKIRSSVDTSTLLLKVDTTSYASVGAFYDSSTQLFRFRIPTSLGNGSHKLWLYAGSNLDSLSFTVQAGFVQITNLNNFITRNVLRTIYGVVEDTSIHSVSIVHNSKDTLAATATGGLFSVTDSLVEGQNTFKALARDTTGTLRVSDSVTISYIVVHAPTAKISFSSSGSTITVDATSSTDPDTGQTAKLTFQWISDSTNPEAIASIQGPSPTITVNKPGIPGDYYFSLVATDPDGNSDTTRNFFTLNPNGTIDQAGWASIPQWARNGRIYSLFFKSMTSQGTINAALPFLPYIQSLGFDVLWVLPVMQNASTINNGPGPGYNIVDFYRVAPEYGTNEDFRNFVQCAHQLGLKVILDVTPNHTSYQHPFAIEGKSFRQNSPHWTFYQHQTISTTGGDGSVGPQQYDADGFVYYSGFSSQLLNYNWADVDARYYMVNVYRSWVTQFGLDGYRFDVYWGPHNRANNGAGGENEMGVPVRSVLKHIKPDIFLLGETAGTGTGTEVNYADDGGGVDAAYDWNLKGAVQGFSFTATSIDNLDATIHNGNYYPGPNSSFLRFLENQDEERIAYIFNSYQKTMPMATVLFTVPGIPMIWSGEEVGFGYNMQAQGFDYRRRGVIDWNYGGKGLLTPHYQRIAQARAQFPAFWTHSVTRIASGNSLVYSYVRPYNGEDGIVAVNFGSASTTVTLPIGASVLGSLVQEGKVYYASDLYNDTSYSISFSGGTASLQFNLTAYGSSIFVLSDTTRKLTIPPITSVESTFKSLVPPTTFVLHQNYPNPFNPSTTLSFDLPQPGITSLRIYNILGQEIATLVDGHRAIGQYRIVWDGSDSHGHPAKSGVYFARLQSGSRFSVTKMLLIR